jgi:hypothetical protein
MPGQAPPVTEERGLLLAYLAQQRDGICNAAYGLSDDQARLTPSASSLSIGGLIKHVADVEKRWVDIILQRDGAPRRPTRSRPITTTSVFDLMRLLPRFSPATPAMPTSSANPSTAQRCTS